jgi:hypothetical protein
MSAIVISVIRVLDVSVVKVKRVIIVERTARGVITIINLG